MDAVAESVNNPASKKQPIRFSLRVENERGLRRDGTAEPVSRDQILRGADGEREKITFPVQLTTSRIGNHIRFFLLKMLTMHNIPTYNLAASLS